MKYLIICVLILNVLYGNDSQCNSCCFKDSGFDVNYQNQLNSLGDKISDMNSNNKLLEQKLADTEKYYGNVLKNQEMLAENQLKQLKIVLEEQEKNHQNVIDNLFYLFHLIVAIFFIGVSIASYIGIKRFKKMIDKRVSSEHNSVTARLVNEFAESSEFMEVVRAEMDLYFSRDENENEEEDNRTESQMLS